ncbi:glycosyl transferase family 1 [Desulfobacteraceae bacterium SEEP-SAG10]|nr:glycosyl transferase family 1 [Desulfobacteraceae bacterium SEEP-SAG10]
MTIVIICDYAFIKGGDTKVAITSAKALQKRGYKVICFAGVEPIDEEMLNIGVEVICTKQFDILNNENRLYASLQGIWNYRAQVKLSNLLKGLDKKHTIIHVHSVVKALSPSIYKILEREGFKVVCTLHDYFLACPNGSFYDFQNNHICNLIPLSAKCILRNCDSRRYGHKLWRLGRACIQKYYYKIPRKLKYFITLSDLSKKILRRYLPQNAYFYKVNNPIDVNKEHPVNIVGNNYFAFVGRLSREKGVEMLAETSKKIKRKIVFIGDGPLRNKIEKINPNIMITGWKDKKEINELLQSARALIFPSLWYETSGLVVLESAALGLPAIVPDTSASKELVRNNVTGLWFRGGDIMELINKINLLEDTSYAKKLGKAAYENYWNSPFTIDRHVNNLEFVYNDILNR